MVRWKDTVDLTCLIKRFATTTIEVRLPDSQDMDYNVKLERMSEVARHMY